MTSPVDYFVNLNYICNERCVFCAAGLAGGPQLTAARPRGVTLADIADWIADRPPRRGDVVAIAGGEPTIHRELLPVVRMLARDGPEVSLFTNGLRLSEPRFASAVLDAGVTHVQIGLFGATAGAHDGVTGRAGSFERTLRALEILSEFRKDRAFTLEVRLLVARQSVDENPGIVRVVHHRASGVDVFSLNRLILSDDAAASDAAVSLAEAADAINETATLVQALGHELRFDALPLCVYRADNAERVRAWVQGRRDGPPSPRAQLRYLDPHVASGRALGRLHPQLALPPPCRACDYLAHCGRVEQWYVQRFGNAGLSARRPERARVAAGAAA